MTDPYVALASDGEIVRDVTREEAFEWADSRLETLDSTNPEEDHWVQINSYSTES